MDLLNRYMEDIESRIQPEEEQSIWAAWMEFAQGACKSGPFVPPARTPRPSAIEWMPIAINDAIENEESMLLSQLSFLNEQLRTANGLPLHIRANYGVGNLPSMFGAERFLMPPETNTLPNVRPLPGGLAAIEKLVEAPLPAPTAGNGRAIAAIGQKFMALRAQYPKFARYVIIDHPDLQGPMDVCELLVGSDLFYALYDEPALIHALLAKITAQYQRAMEFWLSIVPNAPEGYASYFGELSLGKIVLRNDSAMNLSPEMYEEFIRPYDAQLLRHFGGGTAHFCGRGEHFIDAMSRIPDLHGINMSQPHLNDMGKILSCTVDRGIPLRCAKGNYDFSGHNARLLYQF